MMKISIVSCSFRLYVDQPQPTLSIKIHGIFIRAFSPLIFFNERLNMHHLAAIDHHIFADYADEIEYVSSIVSIRGMFRVYSKRV